MAKIWCVKMDDDAHQPDELSSQLRVMNTYLKARHRLSDLLGAQRNDGLTSNLKRSIENGSPDKGDVEEDNDRILRQYFMQREGRLYLNKDGIVPYKGREDDKILYKYNAIVLPQLYQTELLFRSHDQMGHQGINKVYQSFMGTANYYHELIKGYADKVYPIQKLMRNKGKKFEWNESMS